MSLCTALFEALRASLGAAFFEALLAPFETALFEALFATLSASLFAPLGAALVETLLEPLRTAFVEALLAPLGEPGRVPLAPTGIQALLPPSFAAALFRDGDGDCCSIRVFLCGFTREGHSFGALGFCG